MSHLFLHGFGARYDLPISLALYLFGGGAVVVLSFVIVVLVAGDTVGEGAVDTPRWRAAWLDPVINSPGLRTAGGIVGLLVLAAIIVSGLIGHQAPTRNPAEYLLWIYFWAGLVILSGLVGNLWTLFCPWPLAARVLHLTPARTLPERLGIWPAVLGFFLFALLELASGLANRPYVVGLATLLYAGVSVAGMATFGRDQWLHRCDPFTVLFDIVGRFGPVEIEVDEGGRRVGYLRPWGTGLLRGEEPGWSWIVFVVLMLSTLAFDGLLATSVASGFAAVVGPPLVPLGAFAIPVLRTLGLLLLTGVFIAAFGAVMRLVMWFGWPHLPSPVSRWDHAPAARALSAFALTLVPIALVYNAAHNYGYLVIQSQGLIPLLADPLGKGWNLLPTAGYRPSFLLAGAAVVWYVQVVLIVLGHMIAVYLSHLRAAERFKDGSHVLLSQYPMLGLMVLYTMTSLWILAQPITREL